ncbi:MAG: hypothetical protein IPI60_07095 [Saprospiraceae bacterium]|nr:hypothetical protein [Saprospiraceae bacterium]
MRIISLSVIFIGLVLIAVSCKDRAAGKRYGIKKGIVVSESIYSANRAKSTITLHFDDYGDREYTIAQSETGVNGVMKMKQQHSLLDGEFLYTWDTETKKGSSINMLRY